MIVARGVDTNLFSPARRDPLLRSLWRVEPDDTVAICVGRVAPEKNLELPLETFEALRKRHPRAKLVVVGDGPERPALISRYPNVVFSGSRMRTDLAAHYATADLFLYPSLAETYGNVTVEALASGVPVVAFRYAAAAQHVSDGENGMTVEYGDREGFIQAAVDIVKDRERLRLMGRSARDTMACADWSHIVCEFEEALLALSAGPARDELGNALA